VISVLLVEDDDADAEYIARMLKRSEDVEFAVDRSVSLKSALQVVEMSSPDIVLLDLSLPDSHGYDTVVEFTKASSAPFVVLTGNNDVQMAMRTVSLGAQDYIIKDETQPKPLERAICIAAKRAAKDRIRRKLEHQSRTVIMDSDADRATVSILKPQVSRLVEAIEDLKRFLDTNAPGMSDDVGAIFDKHALDVTIKQIRDTLRLHADGSGSERPLPRGRSRLMSDTAMRTVNDVIESNEHDSIPPSSSADADATLLDILSRREGGSQ